MTWFGYVPAYVKNDITGVVHFSPDGESLACRRRLVASSSGPDVYGVHEWCQRCHRAAFPTEGRG